MEAAKEIEAGGKVARVVSMVCWELFDEQDAAYKEAVLPKDVTARVRLPPCTRSLHAMHDRGREWLARGWRTAACMIPCVRLHVGI